ncbi:hypothetical protein AMS68_001829, partial [Peltaster fructicola]
MQSIRQIQRLNDAELEKCVPPNASWHTDYRDTAYVYIGGLPFELSEGDVLTIFSQYGNPVHVNLVRDKETGKSRGFAFLKYEDQRSCDLAVDNLSGAGVLGRTLTVDHTRYKLKEGEIEGQGLEEDGPDEADDTDQEGEKRRKRRRTDSNEEPQRPMIKEELELAKLLKDHDDDDPMKAYLIKEKKEQITEALKNLAVDGGVAIDTGPETEIIIRMMITKTTARCEVAHRAKTNAPTDDAASATSEAILRTVKQRGGGDAGIVIMTIRQMQDRVVGQDRKIASEAQETERIPLDIIQDCGARTIEGIHDHRTGPLLPEQVTEAAVLQPQSCFHAHQRPPA